MSIMIRKMTTTRKSGNVGGLANRLLRKLQSMFVNI